MFYAEKLRGSGEIAKPGKACWNFGGNENRQVAGGEI
jgi:hypothetical protein